MGNAQSTPLAVEGIIYVAAGYSIVYAVDAKTGKRCGASIRASPWSREINCAPGAGVRGLAYSQGQLFVGTHDGRLIALDAKKGTPLWTTPTLDANDASSSPARRAYSKARSRSASAIRVRLTAAWAHSTPPPASRCGAGRRRAAAAQSGTPSPTTRKQSCVRGHRQRARRRCREESLCLQRRRTECRYRRNGLELRRRARRSHCSATASTDITLADDQHRRPAAQRHFATRRRTAPSTCSIAPAASIIASKKLGMGSHNHFAQSFNPKTGLATCRPPSCRHRIADGDAPRGFGQERAGGLGSREAAAGSGQSRRRARSAEACSRPPATSCFQGQADGYLTAYSAADGRRVWAFYTATAALGAPISFAIGKRQYISILNGPTQGTAGQSRAMSARFGWDSRAHPRRLLDLRARWHGCIATHAGSHVRHARRWERSGRR